MKKSSFWNFWFSLVPGCGQLYLGSTSKGVILLSSFFGICALSAALRLEIILFVLPVIWFYSFFDAMNERHLSPEQIADNDKTFSNKFFSVFNGNLIAKRHIVIGILLIVVGGYLLLDNFMPSFLMEISWVRHLFYNIPTLLASLGIIIIGALLLKGKSARPDFIEYKGGEKDGKQQ